jgi:tetratricopeptide (TPR) repeat protein
MGQLALTLLLLAGPLVFAQSPAEEHAKQLYAEGQTSYDSAQYGDALKDWQSAYKLSNKPLLLYNIALAQEKLGQYSHAIDTLTRYKRSQTPVKQTEVNKKIAALKTLQSRDSQAPSKTAKAKRAANPQIQDAKVADNAGVLGSLRDGGELDGVFGSSNLSSDLQGGIGGLIGAKGTQIGSGGLGSRGSGLGGGGSSAKPAGASTRGRGSGRSGYGPAGGNVRAKGGEGIGRIGGDPIILGALKKSLIDAVIKRHIHQIRYCYQRELTKDPNLGGKLVVKFVISKDGSVSKASTKKSTMGSKAVEECINSRFMRFRFPEPKGGGIVIVSYPFIFSPS